MSSSSRIKEIANIYPIKNYLEIGVQKGRTFLNLDFDYQVAVDPAFRFDFGQYASDKRLFFQETSDNYFSRKIDQYFDLIFLDGLHTFEQTFRDFCRSIRYSHDHTIWIIDDTLPSSLLAASENTLLYKVLRRVLRQPEWMGDVYKVVYAIHDYFPQYEFATFENPGQTVVWKSIRKDFKPFTHSMYRLSKMSYLQFLKTHDKIFNKMQDKNVYKTLREAKISQNK